MILNPCRSRHVRNGMDVAVDDAARQSCFSAPTHEQHDPKGIGIGGYKMLMLSFHLCHSRVAAHTDLTSLHFTSVHLSLGQHCLSEHRPWMLPSMYSYTMAYFKKMTVTPVNSIFVVRAVGFVGRAGCCGFRLPFPKSSICVHAEFEVFDFSSAHFRPDRVFVVTGCGTARYADIKHEAGR